MTLICDYPKLVNVTATDKQYSTTTTNKSFSTVIKGNTAVLQITFQVGQTVINNWTELQDACWFMGAGVGKYEVLQCQLGGIYDDSLVCLVTTLGSVSYRIRAGFIERASLQLYDEHVDAFFGSNTFIADFSAVFNQSYSNTFIIS